MPEGSSAATGSSCPHVQPQGDGAGRKHILAPLLKGRGRCESGRSAETTGIGKERAEDGERVWMRENTHQADMQRAGKKA